MSVPASVRTAWGWDHDAIEIAPLSGGLINATFAVRRDGAPIAVVQRLHPVFGGAVNLDLERITAHLAGHGLTTPRLLRTTAGEAWLTVDDRPWRALTWIDGVAFAAVPSLDVAAAGGELVGRFHRAVADLEHDYAFTRAGVHDTAAHLARLRARIDTGAGEPADRDLGQRVLAAAAGLPPMPPMPLRHCHGDLKISNLLFAPGSPTVGVCLVDLDTLGRQTLAFELGDAMRSWCNAHGEDLGTIAFDLEIFAAAIAGWRDVVGDRIGSDERAAIVVGLETVCVELAARFTTDVFDDAYFGWDPGRFASRRDHNRVRAEGQLALAGAVRAARAEARDIVAG